MRRHLIISMFRFFCHPDSGCAHITTIFVHPKHVHHVASVAQPSHGKAASSLASIRSSALSLVESRLWRRLADAAHHHARGIASAASQLPSVICPAAVS